MTASTIHHRPTRLVAAAAAVAALAAGAAVVAATRDAGSTVVPTDRSQVAVHQDVTRTHHVHPTTSGGRVMTAP